MINIEKKADCCGCQACGDICPRHAISFKNDNEGFWYPEVDKDICVDCGLCDRVCPMLTSPENICRYEDANVYAAYSRDEIIRVDSTSGGLYSMLAMEILNNGGYMGGAIYNDDHTVSQIVTSEENMLQEIRSSKYLQSNSVGVYKEILRLLREGEKILYCGCPCQIHALYNYLGNDHDNLITCDFVCRGVNSPKVFLKYMEMLESQYKAKATKIKFKAKKWGWHNFSMRVNFENGKEYCKDRWHDLFFIGYLQSGNFARPSCYECPFKGFPQKADITLADFWGIENIDPTMDQDMGTSLVMINSNKGEALFDKIKDDIVWRQFSMKEARQGNPAIDTSLSSDYPNRVQFFKDVDNLSFDKLAKKYFPVPSWQRKLSQCYRFFKNVYSILKMFGISFQSWYTFIKLNYTSKYVERKNNGILLNERNTFIQFEKGSKLELSARLRTGIKQVRKSRMETRILLEENSELIVDGDFVVYAGSYIRVAPNSRLVLHGGFINENVQITAGDMIEIGEGFTCGRDVVIRSFDGHRIMRKGYKVSEPILIGNHVWIGQGATILKGVTVADGAIIASKAVVTKNVPYKSVVAGCPAKVIEEDISWEK